MTNKMTLKELKTQFKGKGGDPEAESIVIDSNFDKKDGTVSVWSNKMDVAKIIDRCEKDIISFAVQGNGVSFVIDRKAFRGVVCSFRKRK